MLASIVLRIRVYGSGGVFSMEIERIPSIVAAFLNVIASRPPTVAKLAPISGITRAEERPESLLVRAHARIDKARMLLGRGIIDEAGEEAWRAVVDAINAGAAALWGVVAKSHKATSYLEGKIAEYLERTQGRDVADALRSAYGSAESLHNNYYDPRFDAKTVEANIKQAERILQIIKDVVRRSHSSRSLDLYLEPAIAPHLLITSYILAGMREISAPSNK